MNIRVFGCWMMAVCAASAADWLALSGGGGLKGWKVECRDADRGKVYWSERDGVIECDTAGDRKHNYVWLVSEREFGDFELECLVRSFADSPGNSGIQIRSRFLEHPETGHWLHGPQVDLHPPQPWRSGILYDETWGTRRWISPPMPSSRIGPEQAVADWRWVHADGSRRMAATRKVFDGDPALPVAGNWNHVRIVARGLRVRTEINGLPITDFDGTGILDDAAHQGAKAGRRGHLALQLHSGDDLKIQFKDIRVRPLDAAVEESMVVVVRNDAELAAAVDGLKPGSVLRIAPGRYRPGLVVRDKHGTAERPIVIEGLDPRSPPVFEGGNQAWQFSEVSHLMFRWVHCRGQKHNGINLDDGGSYETPAHHIEFSHLKVEDVGPEGNFDGIKCSGVDDLRIHHCEVAGWGGQAIDFVGCHRAEISHCAITGKPGFSQHTGPQFKGGSSDVWLHDCVLENAGQRPVQVGGSTGLAYFRPQDAPFEARRVRIANNRITGGLCAAAFTGADQCVFEHNTVVGPEKWIFRILQESRGARFVRCGDNVIRDNRIVFDRAKVATEINIGPGTRAESFRFEKNQWYARDVPEESRPQLPAPEKGGVYGVDPETL